MSSEQSKKQIDALSVDWELANTGAAEWARTYGADLVNRLIDATDRRVTNEIAAFIQNGENMGQLRARLEKVFSPERAELIAATEVTRAFAEGNLAAWRESGVTEGKEWLTREDEIVCVICGPLNETIVGIDEQFQSSAGAIDGPPAHPRCRCSIAPVVRMPE